MCGILTYYNNNGITKHHVLQSFNSLKSIKHRGPDGEGVVLINTKSGDYKTLRSKDTLDSLYCDINDFSELSDCEFDLLLGHRRLSIFDTSSAGHQPMADNKGNWIVFNGEIYNFWEIRDELKSLGYCFNTGTDTETILAAYSEWGAKCLNKFNGMWSFVIWDNSKKQTFVSNDRFGVKPLYYYQGKHETIFTSEIKQFTSFNILKQSDLNFQVINTFLDTSYLDYDDQTFFKTVKRFKCSHYLISNLKIPVEDNQKKYYTIKHSYSDYRSSNKYNIEQFKALLKSAVKLRMRADVNLGITVSGGLDSSAIVYNAKEILNKPIKTFSAIFPNRNGDESKYINHLVNELNLTANYVNPLEEFNFSDLENHIYHQDFPIQSTSFYAEWCVARLVKDSNVKIILNGQGADEVFAGYHHHFYKYCKQLILTGNILRYLSEIKSYSELKKTNVNSLHTIALQEFKLQLKFKLGLLKKSNKLANKWNCAKSLIELLKIDFFETTIPTYLRSDDRDGMAFSIESRHPFMDYRLVEFGYSLPHNNLIRNGWQKWIIRKALDTKISDSITWRKDKKGYTTPQKQWEEKYLSEFKNNLHLVSNIGIKPKSNFLNYSLGLWLKKWNVLIQ